MSVGNQETVIFLSLRKGKLCRIVPEGTPKSYPRTKNDQSIVYELRYNYIEGHITDIVTKKTPYVEDGKETIIRSWVLTVIDESWAVFKVEINYNSSYAKQFLNRIPNIDFTEQVRLLVGESPKENDPTKMQGWLSVSQNRQKVLAAYTKEEPGRLPQLDITEQDGKTIYNDEKQMAYYEELVQFHKVAFRHPDGTYTYPAIIPETKPETTGTSIEKTAQETDDLPF